MIQKASVKPRQLRPQLIIAFCLMSVIPILALLNFIFPSFLPKEGSGLVIISSIVLSIFGFFVIKKIVDSIIQLNQDVKSIACGELSRKIDVGGEGEIGELSQALNQLSHHIKDNMDELKIYGERTKDINCTINKQVVALSGVLQIGSLISAKTDLKDIFETVVSRLGQVSASPCSFIVLRSCGRFDIVAHFGLKDGALIEARSPANEHVFNSFLSARSSVLLDEKDRAREKVDLLKLLGAKSALIQPIVTHGEPKGLLGIVNFSDPSAYTQDDAEYMDVFVKQLSIAIDNDYLVKKVEDLEVKDALTELYNRRYIVDRLDEEILRAMSHQRPCAFIALKLKNLKGLFERSGELAVEELLKKVAGVIKDNFGELDRAGRINYDEFGIILSERNKKQAQELAEQIRSKLAANFPGGNDLKKQDIAVAVVENPVDGEDSSALLDKAEKLINNQEKIT